MPSTLSDLTARQLRQAASIRERIDELQKQLESILGAAPSTAKAAPAAKAAKIVSKPKRKLSPAARAARSKQLKARWAKVKAAGKKSL
jgi:outer membrane protein TolC